MLLVLLIPFLSVQLTFSQEIKASVSHPSYMESVNDLCMVGNQLWLASSGGIVQFNTLTGTFACYDKSNAGLPLNHVDLISPYADGQIAYSTAKGIGIFRDTTTVSFLKQTAIAESLNSKYRTKMEFFGGKLYVGILNRILIYDLNTWTTLNTLPPYMSSIDLVNDFEQGPNGHVFAATLRGACEIVGDTLLKELVKGRSVTDLAFLSDVMWLASPSGLYNYKDSLTQILNSVSPTMKTTALSDNLILRMKKSVDGKLWLLTRKGLTLYDPSNRSKVYFPLDTLRIAATPLMAVDARGHVWLVGQKPGRIWEFNGVSWKNYSLNKGLASNYISAFVPSGKHVWIGCKDSTLSNFDGKGSCVYDSAAISLLKHKHPIYSKGKRFVYFADSTIVVDQLDSIRALIKSGYVNKMAKAAYDSTKGIYWAATKAGLERIKDSIVSTISVKALGATTDGVYGLYLEQAGSLLVSTYPDPVAAKGGQLMRYNAGSLQILYTCPNPYQYISAVVKDSTGALWMGVMNVNGRGKSFGGGVVCMKNKGVKVYTSTNSALPSNSVSDISIDKNGSIWLASFEGGVSRLTMAGVWSTFTADNSSLESDLVEQIAVDADNNIWASTLDGGLTYLAGDPVVNKVVTALKPMKTTATGMLEIYPMPCSTEVNLKFNVFEGNARVMVFNLSGQKLQDGLFTVPQGGVLTLPINALSKGMYLLKVSTNGSIECKRLIVQ